MRCYISEIKTYLPLFNCGGDCDVYSDYHEWTGDCRATSLAELARHDWDTPPYAVICIDLKAGTAADVTPEFAAFMGQRTDDGYYQSDDWIEFFQHHKVWHKSPDADEYGERCDREHDRRVEAILDQGA